MRLREKQQLFAALLAELIVEARAQGYGVVIGEVHRPDEMAKLYARRGVGIFPTIHGHCLAADISLFADRGRGEYLTETEDYESLGVWWEQRHPLCRWGGRFRRKDGCHFSITHGGMA